MSNQIFRQKSVDKVSSPEQLDDYIKVSNPGVWMVLTAIIILLIGVLAWGVLGKMDTVIQTVGISQDGVLTCYVKEENIEQIKQGMPLSVENVETVVQDVSSAPIVITENTDPYVLHVGNLMVGEWVYTVTAKADVPTGTYKAKIVTERVSPLSFVIN